jgi:hypothetical protein
MYKRTHGLDNEPKYSVRTGVYNQEISISIDMANISSEYGKDLNR